MFNLSCKWKIVKTSAFFVVHISSENGKNIIYIYYQNTFILHNLNAFLAAVVSWLSILLNQKSAQKKFSFDIICGIDLLSNALIFILYIESNSISFFDDCDLDKF